MVTAAAGNMASWHYCLGIICLTVHTKSCVAWKSGFVALLIMSYSSGTCVAWKNGLIRYYLTLQVLVSHGGDETIYQYHPAVLEQDAAWRDQSRWPQSVSTKTRRYEGKPLVTQCCSCSIRLHQWSFRKVDWTISKEVSSLKLFLDWWSVSVHMILFVQLLQDLRV